VGIFGIAGTFSFCPEKNLGICDNTCAIVANDDEGANRVRGFADQNPLENR